MFLQQAKSGEHTYLHLVENRWENGRSREHIIATYGRVDELEASGDLDRLLQSSMGPSLEQARRGHRAP